MQSSVRSLSAGGGLAALAFVSWIPLHASASIVSEWNKVALAEVRIASKKGPPAMARALAITHTCIYEAWAPYDKKAIGTVLGASLRRPGNERTDANMSKAISFAGYHCLLNLFPAGEARLRSAMIGFGFNPDDGSTDPGNPAGVGNLAALAVIDSRRNDGSNQYGDLSPGAYSDYTGYAPRNSPMGFCTPQIVCPALLVDDPMHWQPLISDSVSVQRFVAPHWEKVRPFALVAASQYDAYSAIIPPPDIQNSDMLHYQRNVDELLQYSRDLNPQRKLIVEYWADGPDSELPPGHWGLFAQFVSQRDKNSIADDAKMFFAMHNASFDASIVAWHLKRKFDGVRPITAVRYLEQGKAVQAWGGPGRPTELIQGEKWMPYNPGSNLSPAFPDYVSGHSIFSRASATVLQFITGSDKFGYSTVISPGFGRVEAAIPAVATTIKFATFDDAANQAGLSRLYAGIHFSDDNTVAQTLGQLIGALAYNKALLYFQGKTP